MNNKNNSLGFVSILTLIFIVLKLCKIINWNWILVLSPIWIWIIILILMCIIYYILFIK